MKYILPGHIRKRFHTEGIKVGKKTIIQLATNYAAYIERLVAICKESKNKKVLRPNHIEMIKVVS